MIMDLSELNKDLNAIISNQYFKMILADLTSDEYQVLQNVDSSWIAIEKMLPTDKISEWFGMFSESPELDDNDRLYFKQYSNIEFFRSAFIDNSIKPIRISYKRRRNRDEVDYSPALMEMFPSINSKGHLLAYIFVKDITSSYDSISKRDADEIKNDMISKEYREGKKTALVIEDNEINRELLCAIISENYNTIDARNGKEGLDILKKRNQEISIILLDVQMPVMSGYEFMKEVSKSPVLNCIPIIVLTANEDSSEEERCLKYGAADFIKKPYNPTVVLSRIASLIRLRESVSALLNIEFDELTGVYTKEAFLYHMGRIMAQNPNADYSLTVCDIGQFKIPNNMYREELLDSLMTEVIKTLSEDNEPESLYGRTAKDILAVFAPSKSKAVDEKLMEKKLDRVSSLKKVNADVKFGKYSDINHSLSASVIYDRVITALSFVKHQYNVKFAQYDGEFEAIMNRQNIIERSMKEGLTTKQFVVYYQPKHVLSTGELIGAEALIRWVHPKYGFMAPNEFIPIFEKTGFITEADRYVWETVCNDQRKWIDSGINTVPVSVNLSKMDFIDDDLVPFLESTIIKYNIDPQLMHLEITETLFSEKVNEIIVALDKCKEIGFQIELDDFGTGYSSLNILGELPLDIVKLDRSFMSNLYEAKRARVFEAIIMLAKSLKLSTICEGVETEEQLNVLRQYGVDCVQGYYYSKPIPEYLFGKYLNEHRKEN